jgi:hypothetical protein
MSVLVRVGLPKSTGSLPDKAFELGAPVLVSANSLWDNDRGYFREPGRAIAGLDVALDSAGFVAAALYGGYRWTVEDYVALAGSRQGWTWWAAMDFACEPELAGSQHLIDARIWRTVYYLAYCRKVAKAFYVPEPMPVIQGWRADDYEACARLMEREALDGVWPELVGVGSVCRRHEHGPAGLHTILGRLDRILPPHVQLHLFGVKSTALGKLAHHPRVASVDSMAWDDASRREANAAGESNTMAGKFRHMEDWWTRQQRETDPAQGALF